MNYIKKALIWLVVIGGIAAACIKWSIGSVLTFIGILLVSIIGLLLFLGWITYKDMRKNSANEELNKEYDLPNKRFDASCNIKNVPLGKSNVKHQPAEVSFSGSNVLFHTIYGQSTITPIKKAETSPEFNILSSSFIEKKCQQSDKYEIRINFSIQNSTPRTISILDIHAHLYAASAGYYPLAIGYINRYRIDLYEDNSIFKSGSSIEIEPNSVAYINLAFENSYYGDTGNSLLVFGLYVDFRSEYNGRIHNYRIPSDKIYVIQYFGPPSFKRKVYIIPMDKAYIDSGYEKVKNEKDTPSAFMIYSRAETYQKLEKIFEIHTKEGIVEID
jgi:hypothetical protein